MLEEASKRSEFLAPSRAYWDIDARTLDLYPEDYGVNTNTDT